METQVHDGLWRITAESGAIEAVTPHFTTTDIVLAREMTEQLQAIRERCRQQAVEIEQPAVQLGRQLRPGTAQLRRGAAAKIAAGQAESEIVERNDV